MNPETAKQGDDKYSRLLEGVWSLDYRSKEEADIDLCRVYASLSPDKLKPKEIDHWFRNSPLMESKWDHEVEAGKTTSVLLDMQADWVAISHSGNLRPVLKAIVSPPS